MVNIVVNKDTLAKMVEYWLPFSIKQEKEVREVPVEWKWKLEDLWKRWNQQKKIGNKKWLPKTRKLLNTHFQARWKIYRELYDSKSETPVKSAVSLASIWLKNYIEDIKKRDDWWYWDHRFTLYEFLKQSNGLRRFIAK